MTLTNKHFAKRHDLRFFSFSFWRIYCWHLLEVLFLCYILLLLSHTPTYTSLPLSSFSLSASLLYPSHSFICTLFLSLLHSLSLSLSTIHSLALVFYCSTIHYFRFSLSRSLSLSLSLSIYLSFSLSLSLSLSCSFTLVQGGSTS